MTFRKPFRALFLSSDGLALVHRGLRDNRPLAWIVAELAKTTGETITPSSLTRYSKAIAPRLASLREVQDQAAAFVAEIRTGNLSAEDIGSALIAQALFDMREGLKKTDPIHLAREQRERQKVGLKKKELALKTRQVKAAERKATALEAKQKEQQATKAAAPESTELTEAQKAKIRSIYGIEQ